MVRLTNLLEHSQDEIVSHGGQIEPPGMHMINLPYCEDIRHVEEVTEIVELVRVDF